jgi:hypothetical protein
MRILEYNDFLKTVETLIQQPKSFLDVLGSGVKQKLKAS